MARFSIGKKHTDAAQYRAPVVGAGEKAGEIGAISARLADELSGTARKIEGVRTDQGDITRTFMGVVDDLEAAQASLKGTQTDAEEAAGTTYQVVHTGGNTEAKGNANSYMQQAHELETDMTAIARQLELAEEIVALSKDIEDKMAELYAPLGRVEERLTTRQAALGKVASGNETYADPI